MPILRAAVEDRFLVFKLSELGALLPSEEVTDDVGRTIDSSLEDHIVLLDMTGAEDWLEDSSIPHDVQAFASKIGEHGAKVLVDPNYLERAEALFPPKTEFLPIKGQNKSLNYSSLSSIAVVEDLGPGSPLIDTGIKAHAIRQRLSNAPEHPNAEYLEILAEAIEGKFASDEVQHIVDQMYNEDKWEDDDWQSEYHEPTSGEILDMYNLVDTAIEEIIAQEIRSLARNSLLINYSIAVAPKIATIVPYHSASTFGVENKTDELL
ncbi:MAG: hypothetical protein QOJ65_2072, partial [Fimbriimonadaceae bacterium]|nr:hypothetical protein [Fimbriimonadaceae bacterium]